MDRDENTTMSIVTEIGSFGSMDMPDPTARNIEDLYENTTDPSLKKYLDEFKKNGGNA